MTEWYYMRDGQPDGPHSANKIAMMIHTDTLPPDVPVWADGMAGWVAASNRSEFQSTPEPFGTPTRSKAGYVLTGLIFAVVGFFALLLGSFLAKSTKDAPTTPTPAIPAAPAIPATSSPAVPQSYDIARYCQLRSGPSEQHELKVNQFATNKVGETIYLSVDSSTTVQIVEARGDWVEIQVVQPEYLRDSHRGWIPKNVIKGGPPTSKLSGWIRYSCRVYSSRDNSSNPVGYLSPPSAVDVADEGSGWLRLLYGPVKDQATDQFVEMQFDPGLYIEKSNFTTAIPAEWK